MVGNKTRGIEMKWSYMEAMSTETKGREGDDKEEDKEGE